MPDYLSQEREMSGIIRVLVVDDSRTGRALIAAALRRDSAIRITGMANDPLEARDMIIADQPDVITLDVEMPAMNGLQFLEKIMRLRPIPVVMVSGFTRNGADLSIEALRLGAFDCFPKPSAGEGIVGYARLVPIVKQAAAFGVPQRRNPLAVPKLRNETLPNILRPEIEAIFIGASTGGVEALGEILPALAVDALPVVVTQHMPRLFTASLASRLNRLCGVTVVEASQGDVLRSGTVYIAPGGDRHLRIDRSAGRFVCDLAPGGSVNGHCPSIDELFYSAAENFGPRCLGIILTGMGSDGAAGLGAMRKAGALTIGQDEASCVVYGMPRVAAERGSVARVMSLPEIASVMAEFRSIEPGVV
ncbi:protein-glutamate methylesterase/protein-glutamine glutaminase [Acetobacter nitrogenifigens]|uniref:protein-glutamate methylesterase/protein-glutamine glutaminase n=1 Tax=Acetobacter nitrogenifigens TaxID=285268 RepID=UPI0003F4C520|nr:chemotaxis response regulator protein-glutamate methylesterase [Acetobacter nitrogenifigens]